MADNPKAPEIDTSPWTLTNTVVVERYAVLLETYSLFSGQPFAAQIMRDLAAQRDALKMQLHLTGEGLKAANEGWQEDIKRADALEVELKGIKSDRWFVTGFNEGYATAEAQHKAELEAAARITAEKDRQNQELREEVERLRAMNEYYEAERRFGTVEKFCGIPIRDVIKIVRAHQLHRLEIGEIKPNDLRSPNATENTCGG